MAKLCQINRVKDIFDRDSLRLIIKALVMSKLYYCSTVWSNTSETNIKKLRAVQNFACRILADTGRYDHVTPALRAIRWLPVEEHLKYRETPITYKCINGSAPPYLSKLFIKRNEIQTCQRNLVKENLSGKYCHGNIVKENLSRQTCHGKRIEETCQGKLFV